MSKFTQLFRVPLLCVLSSVWTTASPVARLCGALLALYLSIALQSAQATTISFDVTNVAGFMGLDHNRCVVQAPAFAATSVRVPPGVSHQVLETIGDVSA